MGTGKEEKENQLNIRKVKHQMRRWREIWATRKSQNIRGKAVIYFVCGLEIWNEGQGWAEEEIKFQRKEKIPKSDLDLAPGFTHPLLWSLAELTKEGAI